MRKVNKYRPKRSKVFTVSQRFLEENVLTSLENVSAFSLYLKLKTEYINHSIFYNTNINKLSKRFGVSHYLMKKHVKILIDKGWARWTKEGHLHISSFKNVCGGQNKKSYAIIPVTKNSKLCEIKDFILGSQIERDYDQQRFMYDLSSGRTKAMSWTSLRKALKKYGVSEMNVSYVVTSDRRIARKTNLSLSSANRLKQRLKEKGILRIRKNTQQIQKDHKGSFASTYIPGKGLLTVKNKNIILIKHSIIQGYSIDCSYKEQR